MTELFRNCKTTIRATSTAAPEVKKKRDNQRTLEGPLCHQGPAPRKCAGWQKKGNGEGEPRSCYHLLAECHRAENKPTAIPRRLQPAGSAFECLVITHADLAGEVFVSGQLRIVPSRMVGQVFYRHN